MFVPAAATPDDMCRFHSQDYVDFLQRVTPHNSEEYTKFFQQYNVMEDCPIFDGLFEFCAKYTGGSLRAASMLNNDVSSSVFFSLRFDINFSFFIFMYSSKCSNAT